MKNIKESQFALLLLLPSLALFLGFGLFPLIYSLYLSFHNVILTKPGPYTFVGLGNYLSLLRDPVFLGSLWKTAYFSGLLIFGGTTLGMLLGLLLDQKFHGKTAVIALLLIPWAIPQVVNALIWKWIFDGNFGIFNALLTHIGVIREYKFWFSESPLLGLFVIALASMWKNIPFVALLILAALQTVPRELYDAAAMDGASSWSRFVHVTIPSIRYTLLIVLILQTTWAVKLFDLIQVLTQGGPGDYTMVTYYYVYILSFDYLNVGKGAAGAYIVVLIIFILAVIYYRLLKAGVEW